MRPTLAVLLPLALRAAAQAELHAEHGHDELEHHDHAHAHAHGEQLPLGYVKYPWQAPPTGFGDGPPRPVPPPSRADPPPVTADSVFSGITTFAHLPWQRCLAPASTSAQAPFDIAILGAPFDTSTSYRPGARFGPSGIRAGSRRLFLYGSYNVPLKHNPLKAGVK